MGSRCGRGRKIADPLVSERHVGQARDAGPDPGALIVGEKEELVFDDWSANLAPELILYLLWLALVRAVQEEVICVEQSITPEFIDSAVEGIGAAASRHIDGGTRAAAVLSGIWIADDLKLLNCVNRRPDYLRSELLDVLGNRVVIDAIQDEVVLQRSDAVNVDAAGAACGGSAGLFGIAVTLDAGNQKEQIVPIAGAERQTANEPVFYDRAGCGLLSIQ